MLTQPALRPQPREVLRPAAVLDPSVQALVDQAAADAYARGVADGRAAGRDEAGAAGERIATAVRAQVDAVLAAARAYRAEQADDVVDTALAAAAHVLGREPHDGGLVLLERVRAAVADLDDAPIVVQAHPDDVTTLAPVLAEVHGLQVVADPGVALGEARVGGRWGSADLTRRAAFARVREALTGAGA